MQATEMSSIDLEKEIDMEADRFARREVWTKAEMCKEDPVHGNSNNSSRLEGMGCREELLKRDKENPTDRTFSQEKDPRTLKRKQSW